MANTVRLRTLIDGERHVVVQVYLKSDGASGELTDEVVLDPASFSPVPTNFTIREIWYSLIGFDAMLEFDATSDTPIWKLPQASDNNIICFEEFGGLKDDKAAGFTGKINLTTNGFTGAGDEGTLIIKALKNF